MTKRKPVLVLFIITAIFYLAALALLLLASFGVLKGGTVPAFAELNKNILGLFKGEQMLINIISVAVPAVLFILIPFIVHLVRKQASVTVVLLLGALVALYTDLLYMVYFNTLGLEDLLKNFDIQKLINTLSLFLFIGVVVLLVGGVFELVTFIVDMAIRVKKQPQAVPTVQEMREEKADEPAPAPAPAEEPKAEEKPEEPKEEPALAPAQEPEVVEEPKEEEKKPEPQQTVININVVGVQPAEEKKEEPKEEEEEKPAPKKAPAKKPAPKKEEKKPAKKAEPKKEPAKKAPAKKAEPKKAPAKKAEPKKEEKPAPRETTTIKKPASRETQTMKKPEVLTNEEGKSFVKAYHISQRKELNKWQVKGAGSDKALKLFDTQKEAIEYANELSAKNGAAVRVHSRAGKMRKA